MTEFVRYFWGNTKTSKGDLFDFLEGHPVCVLALHKALKKAYGSSLVHEMHLLKDCNTLTHADGMVYIDSDPLTLKELREMSKKQSEEINKILGEKTLKVNSSAKKCRNKNNGRRKSVK